MLTAGASTCRAVTGSGQSLAGLLRALFHDLLRAMLFLPSIIARMFAFIYILGGNFWGALGKDSHELQIPDCSGTGLDEGA